MSKIPDVKEFTFRDTSLHLAENGSVIEKRGASETEMGAERTA